MKVICESNNGYHNLTLGKKYELLDIQPGIFHGDYYAVVIGDFKKKVVAYSWRFNLTDEQCQQFINASDKGQKQ